MTKFYREASLLVKVRNQNFNGYVETIEIKGLRVAFSIVKSLAWSTNTAVIRVWNLSQSTRNVIKDYGDQITLMAGYELETGPQILFVGDTTSVSHIYEQPEIVTILEVGDGERFVNQERVSISASAGSTAISIITQISSQMGVVLANSIAADNLVYRQAFEFIGMGKDALTIVCFKLGLQWSIQNEMLQIISLNGTTPQTPLQINAENGMQGVPQRFTYKSINLWRPTTGVNVLGSLATRAALAPFVPPSRPLGYKVNVALNPFIFPGSEVVVSSLHLNPQGPLGSFRVENVRHEGDTFGFNWSSQLELTEVIK